MTSVSLQKRKRHCATCDCEPLNKVRRVEEPHSKKGFMLILNHEIFDDEALMRPGTMMDEKNLVKTFSKFNFEIKTVKDLTHKEIVQLVNKYSNKNFIDFYCLVVAVLSHGEEKNYVSARDCYYEFDDVVVNPLIKNVTLLDRPKIFIINACRGCERNVFVNDSRRSRMEVDSFSPLVPDIQKVNRIPYMKEIIKLHSCYEGFVSYRNPFLGCRFINSLCKHLNERGTDTPIEDIFKLVCNELTDRSNCVFVQCPVVSSTLTKTFCLGDLIRSR
ncbi:Caspase [Pseudolycoriella hygida]|uniref:Caspase n=1 Tax=Pseudolycoriella hygida TaxID=35572 RepID=A0A9Q0NE89_9DIPT|nr:Caspase [Pseudolycoriella hygida]